MNIEVGHYVRTKHGVIGKYVKKSKDNKYLLEVRKDFVLCSAKEENIIKHSPDIIDLIEVRRLCEWL